MAGEGRRQQVAKLVKQGRVQRGLSLSAAAREAGIDRGTWTGVEKATRVPRDAQRAAIERVAGLAPDTITNILDDDTSASVSSGRERGPATPWQSYRVTAEEAFSMLQVALKDYGPGGFWKEFDFIYERREDTARLSDDTPSNQPGRSA